MSKVVDLTLRLYFFLISVRFGPAQKHEHGAQQKKMRQLVVKSPSPIVRTLRPYWMHGQKVAVRQTPQPPAKQSKRPSKTNKKTEIQIDTIQMSTGIRQTGIMIDPHLSVFVDCLVVGIDWAILILCRTVAPHRNASVTVVSRLEIRKDQWPILCHTLWPITPTVTS